jgi:hypothetical protein
MPIRETCGNDKAFQVMLNGQAHIFHGLNARRSRLSNRFPLCIEGGRSRDALHEGIRSETVLKMQERRNVPTK